MKLTKITEYKNNKALTIHNSIIDYEPKNIYIPLFDNNEKYESFVKENDAIPSLS